MYWNINRLDGTVHTVQHRIKYLREKKTPPPYTEHGDQQEVTRTNFQ